MADAVASSNLLPAEIAFEAPENVRQGLGDMGRTEDVRLSPDGRRLAIACYASQRIAFAEVEIDRADTFVEIRVTGFESFASHVIHEPHGLDFVNDQTLVIGNRGGGISLVQIPQAGSSGELRSIGELPIPAGLDAPGSVAVHPLENGTAEIYACHNWADAVTRYVVKTDALVIEGEVVARRWLDLPDGVTLSSDGRWVAVSNHNTHDVFVYERARLGEGTDPVAILRGVEFPHGLRFGADARSVLVADAGAPFVDVFTRRGDSWRGASYASRAIRVMDDATFAHGHHSPGEGGPKGIDVDPRTNVLIVTSEHTPLRFFDLDAGLEASDVRPPAELLRYELRRLESAMDLEAAAVEAREQLAELTATRAWRMTRPLRRAHSAFRRVTNRHS